MNDSSNLDRIIAYQELEKRFNRLTTWQKFLMCLWLLGWTHEEIAEVIGTTPQNVSHVINEGKKRMGVYYQWTKL
jgi:transcriptional regulator